MATLIEYLHQQPWSIDQVGERTRVQHFWHRGNTRIRTRRMLILAFMRRGSVLMRSWRDVQFVYKTLATIESNIRHIPSGCHLGSSKSQIEVTEVKLMGSENLLRQLQAASLRWTCWRTWNSQWWLEVHETTVKVRSSRKWMANTNRIQ